MGKLFRTPKAAQENLIKTSGSQIITRKACRIQVPVRFSTRGLGQVGIDTLTLGCFPVIFDDDTYSLLSVCALVQLNPFKTITVTVDDVEYHEFHFRENDVVFKSSEVVKNESIMFNIFDEFFIKGNVPWYVGYEDLCKLFDTAKSHGGSNVAKNLKTLSFLASIITRAKSMREKYIRTTARTYADITSEHVEYIPLNSVFYAVNSTVNKLSGNYFKDGVVSALVNPTVRKDKIESILTA
jgi:hypothetical protein